MAWTAVLSGNEDLLMSLINSGVDIEQRGGAIGLLSTPLQLAAGSENLSMMRLLLAHGANTEAVDHLGNTMLLVATSAARIDSVKMLLLYGANVAVTTTDTEKTALHIAVELNVVNIDLVDTLIAAGVDVSAADARGWTALHYAAEYGQRFLAFRLMEHNANLLAKCILGLTPADLARRNRHIQLATAIDAIVANRHRKSEVIRKNRCHAFAAGIYNPNALGRSVVHKLSNDLAMRILHAAHHC
jgi:Ankyrin repeats (3 copies)/Ankyrin repeats (many copies)